MMAQDSIKQLFRALEEGKADSVKALLLTYAYSKDQVNSGLIQAVKNWSCAGHSECLDALVAAGGFIRTRDREGRSLLMLAATKGLSALVEELVHKGCEVLEQDLVYRSALHIAIESDLGNTTDTVKSLLKLGANWKLKDVYGNTALHLAAKYGKVGSLLAILEAGCRPDVHNHSGDSPLHLAVRCGHDRCIEVLLKHGASPTVLNKAKVSPIDEAAGQRLTLLSKFAVKKDLKPGAQKWMRSRTAPLESLPDQETLLFEELQSKITEERTAKDRALFRAKTLSDELLTVSSQVQGLKTAIEEASKVSTFPCLFLRDEERPSLQTLFSQLATDLMGFYVEVETWQRKTDPVFREIVAMLRDEVSTLWPQAEVEVFGSYAVQLHLPKSDLNLVVVKGPQDNESLGCLAAQLQTKGYVTDLSTLLTATTPLLTATIRHKSTEIVLNLTLDNVSHTGLQCLSLTRTLVQTTPLLRQMVLILKHLFQWSEVNTRFDAGINSYALIIMTAYFLCSRRGNIDLAETLYALMSYYAMEASYDEVIYIETSSYPYILLEPQTGVVTIQDPLSPTHNVGERASLPALLVRGM